MMSRGISLANKVQLLFGVAVVLIVTAALIVPWFRMTTIIDQSQWETSRQITRLWTSSPLVDPRFAEIFAPSDAAESLRRDLNIHYYTMAEWDRTEADGGFLASAKRRLTSEKSAAGGQGAAANEHLEALWQGDARIYRYARLIPDDHGEAAGVLVVRRVSEEAANQLFVNRMLLLASGVGAGMLAMLVFYLITKTIILSPVRSLRDTADVVRQGNLHVRSAIHTGDEFEQLSDAFNSMLEDLTEQQAQLRGINRSLDLKLTELAERNVELFESARLKDEFLASVSHELRTPLNSIIGFAEILQDIVGNDLEASSERDEGHGPLTKRKRYLDHIVSAGRSLLEMINEMLTMARLEAGNIDLHIQEVGVAAACEGLLALIKPLADRKHIRLSLQLQNVSGTGFSGDPADSGIPLIITDARKFEQIIFNFLSNAVKFTPEHGEVILRAERMRDPERPAGVRVSVLDTGPGIPADMHDQVFEKFTQLETGHTGKAQGTGLGLAIAKQFAAILQAEIRLESQVGGGTMFSLILPPEVDAGTARQAALRMAGRETPDQGAA